MKTQLRKQNRQRGFTIIEVMIVLAIAGLILAIIFLAVPSLQRSARNNQRKNDATHLGGLVADYQANHNGTLPPAVNGVCNTAPCASGTLDVSGEQWSIIPAPGPSSANIKTYSNATQAQYFPTDFSTVFIIEKAQCVTANVNTPIQPGTATSYAVTLNVETSGVNGGATPGANNWNCIAGG